jgi:hypothetical protein
MLRTQWSGAEAVAPGVSILVAPSRKCGTVKENLLSHFNWAVTGE